MNGRRAALLLVIVIGSVAMLWAASRYSAQVASRQRHDVAASPEPDRSGPATLRFYKNPIAVPVFTARDLDGREVSNSSLHGKVLIVNFWATWCPPCRAEIPDLIALQEKYRDQLQIVGISEDEAPVETVKRFIDEHRMNYPVVMLTPDLEKMFPGISALPTSFIVNREGRIVQKHVGMLTAHVTEQEVRSLAGLTSNATVELVDQTQGLKLDNGAQAMTIPGIDLTKLSPAKRGEALQKLNAAPCTCGCDLTVAKCRVDDPTCGVSLPLARDLVQQVSAQP
ncbi:MAG TPA: redoxin domain-containing protein [Vicinamibacterales bacterium]|jgi:thiol-disulfide isomerase/thioredoxin